MAETYGYNPRAGSLYAQTYALFDNVPASQRLFYYEKESDCTNFISQCVWAAYGGWIPGFSENIVKINSQRILSDTRQVKGIWYGSKSNIGSFKWCRVEDFFKFATDTRKAMGPLAHLVAEGGWGDADPSVIMPGDVIQLVVADYAPNRYGHGLYVVKSGASWNDILICCHTDNRLDVPLSSFAQSPLIYSKLRILHFTSAVFDS